MSEDNEKTDEKEDAVERRRRLLEALDPALRRLTFMTLLGLSTVLAGNVINQSGVYTFVNTLVLLILLAWSIGYFFIVISVTTHDIHSVGYDERTSLFISVSFATAFVCVLLFAVFIGVAKAI